MTIPAVAASPAILPAATANPVFNLVANFVGNLANTFTISSPNLLITLPALVDIFLLIVELIVFIALLTTSSDDDLAVLFIAVVVIFAAEDLVTFLTATFFADVLAVALTTSSVVDTPIFLSADLVVFLPTSLPSYLANCLTVILEPVFHIASSMLASKALVLSSCAPFSLVSILPSPPNKLPPFSTIDEITPIALPSVSPISSIVIPSEPINFINNGNANIIPPVIKPFLLNILFHTVECFFCTTISSSILLTVEFSFSTSFLFLSASIFVIDLLL